LYGFRLSKIIDTHRLTSKAYDLIKYIN